MKKFALRTFTWLQTLKHRDEGQGMVEYGLIIALIAVVVIAALVLLGGRISHLFGSVANNLT